MKFFGIDFAPLNIPLYRRMQTLATLQWVLTFLIGGFGMMGVFIFLLFTRFYWVSLLYGIWFYYDRNSPETGGNTVRMMRNLRAWYKMADYFPAKLHKTVDIDPNKSYIFGLHPHGIMQASGFLSFATDATGFDKKFPGLKAHLLVLAGQFMFPFYRDYLLTSGAASVSKASIKWICEHPGHVACVVVGGAVEALEARPGQFNLVLEKRKGFIKQAVINGADLVPVFSFGENEIFDQIPNPEGSFLKKFQLFLTHKVFGFSPPIIVGRGIFNYTFGIMPFRKPINTVVGSPIQVAKIENPTNAEIEAVHAQYKEALIQLFESNKEKFGVSADRHINFVG